MDSKGYYKTLGVAENASEDEIKKAFRKLSIKYHPDKQANKSESEKKNAEAKFKEVNEAYQVLSDKDKRTQYDRGGSFNFGSSNGGYSGDGYAGGFDFGDFNFDEFGFNSNTGFNFRDLFGNRNAYNDIPRKPKIEKGADIRMGIPITIEDIFNGCTKKVKYIRNVRCPNCHGAGGTNKHTCPDCNGTGTVRKTSHSPFGFMQSTSVCSKCGGKGFVTDTKCPTCGGTGYKREETILEINFHSGMLNGFALQKTGMGHESRDPKGASGDFYAICQHTYDQNRYQIVNNIDVYEKVEIPYYDALLGCEYILEKPDHKKIKITIPSCIQNGKRLKLINEGIKSGNIKGDYYIIVIYKIPDKLKLEELKALQTIQHEYNKDNNK